MFWKFLVGCLTLATLLIFLGTLVIRSETRMKSRGKYLAKHFKRYLNYQDGLGRAVSSAADREAADPALRAALSPQTLPGAETPALVDSATAADIVKRAFEVHSGKNGIQPDVMILFDGNGKLLWASPESPIKSADLRELEIVARVRTGSAYFNKVLILKNKAADQHKALQMAGVPIKAAGGDNVVGGILVGVYLSRYMLQYKEQSDAKEIMRHRLTLVHDGQVVASVMPEELWPELGQQLAEQNWGYETEGDLRRAVIRLKRGDFDFHVEDIEGFAGLETGVIGQLFLLRSRSNLRGRGPTFPFWEILVGTILSILIAYLLAIWITKPIKAFVRQSQQILEGETDLTQRITLRSRDETQSLADNINEVFSRLYSLASEVQNASFHVGASSAEISAASRQMLGGLKDQTLKIEGSTAAVTELSASIQQVAANATEATKVAESSTVAVTSAQARMQQIRSAVEDAADKMRDLGESSKRIGNIVEVIRQISEQTSLLALNASIEAAHAGEQGRGFAVVAEEVSSLARRVGQSAKDIEMLIQTIKEQTADAVNSVQVGTREVEGGTELVTNTLQDLGQLIAVVKDTAVAVQEQAEVSDEIARNMDAVQTIAGEVLNGSEESVIQAEQLHSLAFALEQSVGGFNLDSTTSSRAISPSGSHKALRGPDDDDNQV